MCTTVSGFYMGSGDLWLFFICCTVTSSAADCGSAAFAASMLRTQSGEIFASFGSLSCLQVGRQMLFQISLYLFILLIKTQEPENGGKNLPAQRGRESNQMVFLFCHLKQKSSNSLPSASCAYLSLTSQLPLTLCGYYQSTHWLLCILTYGWFYLNNIIFGFTV